MAGVTLPLEVGRPVADARCRTCSRIREREFANRSIVAGEVRIILAMRWPKPELSSPTMLTPLTSSFNRRRVVEGATHRLTKTGPRRLNG